MDFETELKSCSWRTLAYQEVRLRIVPQQFHQIFEPKRVAITQCSWHQSWRTLAYQEVRLRIGPLAKLGRFKSKADNFLVYIVTISLASGPIRSLTSGTLKFSLVLVSGVYICDPEEAD